MSKCKDCTQKGLVLFPFRDTIYPKIALDVHTGIGSDYFDEFKAGILREGYVYVYDEKNRKWYGYTISPKGYLSKINVPNIDKNASKQPDPPKTEKACLKNSGHAGFASIIQIPDPHKMTNLWICYSPVKWTTNVFTKHKSSSVRALTMRKIVVNQLGKKTKHYENLFYDKTIKGKLYKDLPQISRHYKSTLKNPLTKELYMPSRVGEHKALSKAASQLNSNPKYPAQVVKLSDPIGALIDLSNMILQTKARYDVSHPQRTKYFAAQQIKGIRDAIYANAKTEAIKGYDRKRLIEANKPIGYTSWGDPIHGELVFDLPEHTAADHAHLKNTAIPKRQASHWRKFRAGLKNEQATLNFLKSTAIVTAENRLKTVITAICTKHLEILKSDSLKHKMKYYYDNTDGGSGMAYSDQIAMAIGTTGIYEPSKTYYDEQLSKSKVEDDNFVLMALLCNYLEAKEAVNTAVSKGVTWQTGAEQAWAVLGYVGAKMHGEVSKTAAEKLSSVLEPLTASVTTELKNAAARTTLKPSVLAIGFHTKSNIIKAQGVGTRYDAIKAIQKALIDNKITNTPAGKGKSIPKHVANNSIKRAVKLAVQELKLDGVSNMDKKITSNFLILIDADELKRKLGNTTKPRTAADRKRIERIIIEAIRSKTSVMQLSSDKYHSHLLPTTENNKSGFHRAHVLGNILQLIASGSLLLSAAGAKKGEKLEAWGKFGASLAFIGAARLEYTSYQKLVRAGNPDLSLSSAKTLQSSGKTLAALGNIVNVGAAGVFAAFDAWDSYKHAQNDNTFMATLYGLSAASGLVSAALFSYGVGSTISVSLGIGSATVGTLSLISGGILLAVFIVLGFAIAHYSLNPMEEWVTYGVWGSENQGWSYNKTIKEYKNATQNIAVDLDESNDKE